MIVDLTEEQLLWLRAVVAQRLRGADACATRLDSSTASRLAYLAAANTRDMLVNLHERLLATRR
jgi:hypothetical protein